MATFFNQARLSYNGITTTSNTVSGELVEVLTATKNAVVKRYTRGGQITFLLTIVNSGTAGYYDLTVTDDLGACVMGETPVTPLSYTEGSLHYYQNGVLQPAPTVVSTSPLTVTGVGVPAGGNAMLAFEATVNEFAPLHVGGCITCCTNAAATGLMNPVTAAETVAPAEKARLQISKSVSPNTVTERGTLTYTFLISNTGNTAAGPEDQVIVSDTFDPALNALTVSLDGVVLTPGRDYSYQAETGVFATAAGVITVPAAEYTQDGESGLVSIVPGTAALVVSGTV